QRARVNPHRKGSGSHAVHKDREKQRAYHVVYSQLRKLEQPHRLRDWTRKKKAEEEKQKAIHEAVAAALQGEREKDRKRRRRAALLIPSGPSASAACSWKRATAIPTT